MRQGRSLITLFVATAISFAISSCSKDGPAGPAEQQVLPVQLAQLAQLVLQAQREPRVQPMLFILAGLMYTILKSWVQMVLL